MATFNAKSFEKKLKTLDASQTGIQTLSLWILHHKHHAKIITSVWTELISQVPKPERKLALFYLANDVVQNGKRKAKDLVDMFGKAFMDSISLLSDAKIKVQVERVFDIWNERAIFEPDVIHKYKEMLNKTVKPAVESKSKNKEIKSDDKEKKSEEQEIKKTLKPVPPDFKVAKLLVSIKKTTSLDNDVLRKSKLIENLPIDVSSLDSVKHVKGRSSVNKFYKQFEESKVVLEDYCHLLRRCVKDKNALSATLLAGEAYYEAAQEEAKIIVNAYKTFGNRLKSMKKKLEAKIKKLEEANSTLGSQNMKVNTSSYDNDSSQESVSEPVSCDDKTSAINHSFSNTNESNIEDMDLDSNSDDDDNVSEAYNPETAPLHQTSSFSQDTPSFLNIEAMNGMSSFLDRTGSSTVLDLSLQKTLTANEEIKTTSFSAPYSASFSTPFTLHTATQLSSSDNFSKIQENAHTLQTALSSVSTFSSVATLPSVTTTYSLLPSTSSFTNSTITFHPNIFKSVSEADTPVTPVLDEGISKQHVVGNADNKPLQNLIDSLFPMLSKSLQTIKEKTAKSEEIQPSVNDAITFALSGSNEEAPKKRGRFVPIVSDMRISSPLSLTNPTGLSENQTELINIAAGITKFDDNFLPLSSSSETASISSGQNSTMLLRQNSNDDQSKDDEEKMDKKEKKSRHSSSRHRSHREEHKRSASRSPSRKNSHKTREGSRSPNRRSSHRSTRDYRDDKFVDRRRSSRRSSSPRSRRKGRSHRSTSKDKEDRKRRSPATKPYYNDRRSPTPEMDSSLRASYSANIPQGQFDQSMQNQSFSIGPNVSQSQPGDHKDNQAVMVSSGQPSSSHQSNHTLNQSMNLKSLNSIPNMPVPDMSVFLQLVNSVRPGLPLTSIAPPNMSFDINGTPIINPGLQLTHGNSLHIIQTNPQDNILNLHPLPHGVLPFQNHNLLLQNQSAQHQTESSQEISIMPNKQNNQDIENSIKDLSDSTRENSGMEYRVSHQANKRENKLFGPSNPPPFPGPPPVFEGIPPSIVTSNFEIPPNFEHFSQEGISTFGLPTSFDSYRPKFAEPDPLLEQLEKSNPFPGALHLNSLPPRFINNNSPIFRPRYNNRNGSPRFRPRFDHRFPFNGRPAML